MVSAPTISPPTWSCQAMLSGTAKLNAQVDRDDQDDTAQLSRRSRLATTNQAPNRPKTAPRRRARTEFDRRDRRRTAPRRRGAEQVDSEEADLAEQSAPAGPTTISAHMLNRMSRKPRPPSPGPGRNADVISRYHWPCGDALHWPAGAEGAYAEQPQSLPQARLASSTRNSTTLMADQGPGHDGGGDGPAAEGGPRPAGCALARPRTHSTHCCPTAAWRRQSGQAWRPHRTQETQVSLPGCR